MPPRIVIFGPYKSGTTALFHAIRRALPPGTRELFEAARYDPEPADAARPVLAKVILACPGSPETIAYEGFLEFERRIVLARDPRDWLVSGALFLPQQLETVWRNAERIGEVVAWLRAKEAAPSSLPLTALLRNLIAWSGGDWDAFSAWMARQHAWLIEFECRMGAHCLIRYEDFVAGRTADLAAYLGLPVDPCVQVPPEHGHVIRAVQPNLWRNWLTAEDIAWLRPLVDGYRAHYGYDADWTPAARPAIDTAHASAYAVRTMNRRRAAAGLTEAGAP